MTTENMHDNTPAEAQSVAVDDWVQAPEDARDTAGYAETLIGPGAVLPWHDMAGIVMGGVPGSGKTKALQVLFEDMYGRSDIHYFNGKAGTEDVAAWLTAGFRTAEFRGFENGPGELLRVLRSVMTLVDSHQRAQRILEVTGAANFWGSAPEEREAAGLYPIVIAIDECSPWFDPEPAQYAAEKESYDEVISLVRGLIQRGRSLGILVVLSTQKPGMKTIPSVIRDNCDVKVCFRSMSAQAVRSVLTSPDAATVEALTSRARQAGDCVLDVEGRGAVRTRVFYRDIHAGPTTATADAGRVAPQFDLLPSADAS